MGRILNMPDSIGSWPFLRNSDYFEVRGDFKIKVAKPGRLEGRGFPLLTLTLGSTCFLSKWWRLLACADV